MIYQPVCERLRLGDLKQLVATYLRHLYPDGYILYSEQDHHLFRMTLRSGCTLAAIQIHPTALTSRQLESALHFSTQLNQRRLDQNDEALTDIKLNLLVPSCSEEVRKQLMTYPETIQIYRWARLQSGDKDALFLEEVDISTNVENSQDEAHDLAPNREVSRVKISTPEFVALARLGKDLRRHKTDQATPS